MIFTIRINNKKKQEISRPIVAIVTTNDYTFMTMQSTYDSVECIGKTLNGGILSLTKLVTTKLTRIFNSCINLF